MLSLVSEPPFAWFACTCFSTCPANGWEMAPSNLQSSCGMAVLCSEAHRQSEALLEIGKIHHKQRDYRRAARELLRATVLTPDSKQVLLHLHPHGGTPSHVLPALNSLKSALSSGHADGYVLS